MTVWVCVCNKGTVFTNCAIHTSIKMRSTENNKREKERGRSRGREGRRERTPESSYLKSSFHAVLSSALQYKVSVLGCYGDTV